MGLSLKQLAFFGGATLRDSLPQNLWRMAIPRSAQKATVTSLSIARYRALSTYTQASVGKRPVDRAGERAVDSLIAASLCLAHSPGILTARLIDRAGGKIADSGVASQNGYHSLNEQIMPVRAYRAEDRAFGFAEELRPIASLG